MNNVTIMDKNGNGILAEGICNLTITDNGASKNYIFYTLNETVENGLTKIYIAEVTEGPSDARLTDEEWANIKKTMVSILHAEELPNVTFNKIDGNTFNISEPKKLAIDLVKKQTLIDVQNNKILESAHDVPQTESAGPGSFFNPADAVEAPQAQPVDAGVPNIFETPMQPEVVPQALGGITDPTQVPINNVATETTPVQESPQVVEEVPSMEQTLVTSTQDVSAMPEEAAMAAPVQNNKPTMEEVKQALDVLNRYFSDTTNVLTSIPMPGAVPQAVEPAPIPAPIMPEAPVQAAPVPESVNTVPEIPVGGAPQFIPVQPLFDAMPDPTSVATEAAPVMPEAPVQPVVPEAPIMPEAPVQPVVPEAPQVVPVAQMVQDANVASTPVEPVIPGNTAPVQMPTDGANPAMINNAGFEGLTS